MDNLRKLDMNWTRAGINRTIMMGVTTRMAFKLVLKRTTKQESQANVVIIIISSQSHLKGIVNDFI